MTIAITIEVPDSPGQALEQLRDRLPELLEHSLREITAETKSPAQDEQAIIAVLANQHPSRF